MAVSASCKPLRASPRRSAATSAVSQPNQPLCATASRPELVCQPACTPPAGLPSLSRVPRRTGTWRCLASRQLVWSPWPLGPPFLCPASAGAGPELRPRSKPHTFPSQRPRPCPYPTTGESVAKWECAARSARRETAIALCSGEYGTLVPQSRRALPSVEHLVSCHPDSTLHNGDKYSRILYYSQFTTESGLPLLADWGPYSTPSSSFRGPTQLLTTNPGPKQLSAKATLRLGSRGRSPTPTRSSWTEDTPGQVIKQQPPSPPRVDRRRGRDVDLCAERRRPLLAPGLSWSSPPAGRRAALQQVQASAHQFARTIVGDRCHD